MIVCLFIMCILNYYTFVLPAPKWLTIASVIGSVICLIVAMIIWDNWKAEVDRLRREVETYKNNN